MCREYFVLFVTTSESNAAITRFAGVVCKATTSATAMHNSNKHKKRTRRAHRFFEPVDFIIKTPVQC